MRIKSLIFLLSIITTNTFAQVASQRCAPFDGPALQITIPTANAKEFDITLWGSGYEIYRRGQGTVALDHRQATNGTGTASLCSIIEGKRNCLQTKASITINSIDHQNRQMQIQLVYQLPNAKPVMQQSVITLENIQRPICGG